MSSSKILPVLSPTAPSDYHSAKEEKKVQVMLTHKLRHEHDADCRELA
jgi:hypothetical protein